MMALNYNMGRQRLNNAAQQGEAVIVTLLFIAVVGVAASYYNSDVEGGIVQMCFGVCFESASDSHTPAPDTQQRPVEIRVQSEDGRTLEITRGEEL